MRIATYNVEWFNSLFNRRDGLLLDDAWSGRYNVTRRQQGEALAKVFRELDADAVMVIEAPDQQGHRSTVAALENFAAEFGLRTRAAAIGMSNDTQKEIALLYDPDAITVRHAPMSAPDAPRFDMDFPLDLDVDADPETIQFSKPPLELVCETPTGFAFRMIGVHVKSKAPHGAQSQKEVIRISIQNRRKQLAQCIWLRRRVEAVLAQDMPLIVLGDFNDGPGLDEYEKLFGRSGVEIVLGSETPLETQLFDPHASQLLSRPFGATLSSARFYNAHRKTYLSALLDYIMVSPGLRTKRPSWRILHPFDDSECWGNLDLREALLTASDHFPVVLDIEI